MLVLCGCQHKNEEFVPDDCYNMDGKQWTEYPIAVIGSGPAGLTCAYYLRKEGYPVTVFEKEAKPGGMMMNGIPNFRVEKDIVQNEIDIITKMGAEIKCGVEVGKDVTIEELKKKPVDDPTSVINNGGGKGEEEQNDFLSSLAEAQKISKLLG